MPTDKKALSERDIRTKFIAPAVETAGWDVHTQIREEVTFTAGRIIVGGKLVARGKKKRVKPWAKSSRPPLPTTSWRHRE